MTFTAAGGNRVASVAALLVGLALVYVSATIAFDFGQMAGSTPAAKDVLSRQGVLIILIKVIAPFIIYASLRRGHPVILMLTIIALALACIYSVTTVYGYGAAHRGVETVRAASAGDTRAQLEALPKHLPVPVLEVRLANAPASKRAAIREELAVAKEADRLRQQLDVAPVPSIETQVIGLSESTGLSESIVRGFVLAVPAGALELGEMICFFGASLLWGRRESQQPDLPGAKEPVPQPALEHSHTSEARPQRMTLGKWLTAYLSETSGAVTAAEAYEAYLREWHGKRRKALQRLDFGRAFDAAAKRAGMVRSQRNGRLEYRAA